MLSDFVVGFFFLFCPSPFWLSFPPRSAFRNNQERIFGFVGSWLVRVDWCRFCKFFSLDWNDFSRKLPEKSLFVRFCFLACYLLFFILPLSLSLALISLLLFKELPVKPSKVPIPALSIDLYVYNFYNAFGSHRGPPHSSPSLCNGAATLPPAAFCAATFAASQPSHDR